MSIFNRVLYLFAMLLVISGCEKVGTTDLLHPPTTQPLTVMTYNVYVGSSTNDVLAVDELLQVPAEVGKMYDNVIASDFPARAQAIAKSIKTHQPHIIGLQEISLIRRQSPGDRITGGTVAAEEVVLDFLKILMDALGTEGLEYQVAAQVENIDVEMPMITDTGIVDVRLTDYDVLLTRSDVQVSRPTQANYNAAFSIDLLQLDVKRGYVAIDATVNGSTYRVVNTHLESFDQTSRVGQTQELIDSLATETLPIILLGDFNTQAPDGTAYQLLLASDYEDVWQADTDGNTCCQDSNLQNETSMHYERIDLILVCNYQGSFSAITNTIGDKHTDRLPSGLWPSDHAGVVAQIMFTNP